jgi:hypothetical protein
MTPARREEVEEEREAQVGMVTVERWHEGGVAELCSPRSGNSTEQGFLASQRGMP